MQDLDQAGGGPGGQVAGLDHGGAADGEGEGKLLGDDQQREVPGGDDPDHADWFTDGERQIVLCRGRCGRPRSRAGPAWRRSTRSRRQLDTSSLAWEMGLPDSRVSIRASSSRSASMRAATRRSSAAFSAPGVWGQPLVSNARCGGGHGGVDIGLTRVAVAGDPNVVSRAVAQRLVPAAVSLDAVDDIGPDMRREVRSILGRE